MQAEVYNKNQQTTMNKNFYKLAFLALRTEQPAWEHITLYFG